MCQACTLPTKLHFQLQMPCFLPPFLHGIHLSSMLSATPAVRTKAEQKQTLLFSETNRKEYFSLFFSHCQTGTVSLHSLMKWPHIGGKRWQFLHYALSQSWAVSEQQNQHGCLRASACNCDYGLHRSNNEALITHCHTSIGHPHGHFTSAGTSTF